MQYASISVHSITDLPSTVVFRHVEPAFPHPRDLRLQTVSRYEAFQSLTIPVLCYEATQ